MYLRIATVVRVLGFLLGGFVAISAAIVVFVWVSFDASRAGNTLTQYFRDQYQRTLRLGEAPHLRMRPLPVLEFRKLSLSEPGKSEVFASVDTLSLDLQLMPLLLRQTVIHGITLHKPEFHLVRKPDGQWNSADLLAGGLGLQALPWAAQLDKLDIGNGQLKLEDKASASQLVISELSLQTDSLRDRIPGTFMLRGVAHGKEGSENAVKLRAEAHYVLHEQLTAGRIDHLNINLDGDAFGLKGASGAIQTAGLIWGSSGQRLDLAGTKLHLRGALGEYSLDYSGELPALGREGLSVQGKDWKSGLVVRARDRETRIDTSLPSVTRASNGFDAEGLHFKLDHRVGKQSLTLDLSSRVGVDFNDGTIRLTDAQGKLDSEYPALRSGKMSLPLKGKALWHAAQGTQPGGTTLNLNLSHGKDFLGMNAELQKLWPLSGQVDLNSTRLDLDSLFAGPGLQDALGYALPALGEASINGKLSLWQLRMAGMRFTTLKTPLLIDKGKLLATGLTAELYTGKLSGDMSAELASGRFDFKGDFGEVALAPLAKDIETRLPFSGDLGGSYVLNGLFKPGQAIGENLQGAVRWKLQNGALQGFDMARSLREFRSAIHTGSPTARTPATNENTAISAASSRFVFDNGKMVAEAITATNDWLGLNGSGSADLKNREIDFALAASIQPKVAATAARDLADLRGKPLPIRLKGKPAHPDVRFEPSLKIAAATANGKPAPAKAGKR